MALRTRDKRQRNRYAAVLRDSRHAASQRPAVEQIEVRHQGLRPRLLSLIIVLVLSLMMTLFFTADAFYVRSISVGGLRYLTKEEVFAFADIANMHIFWVDPEVVRTNVLRSPSVADARVSLSWPPDMVTIAIEEREPALVWEQGGAAIWVDIQGRGMAQREARADLVRITADITVEAGPLGENGRLEPEVVYGALQLNELLPDLEALRYDPVRGLGYRNSYGWDVWMGTGTGMEEKIAIYRAMEAQLLQQGVQPGEVNIVDPDNPYITVLWGR